MDLKEVHIPSNSDTNLDHRDVDNGDSKKNKEILYGIDDIPPWYLSIPMAFQVFYEAFDI